MPESNDPVAHLSDDECWARLGTQQLGRLVTRIGDTVDIFPVNYVVDDWSIVFRTAEGSKLLGLTVNDEVLFEVDDHDDTKGWSVVVRGTAQRIEGSAEVDRAESLDLHPWVPTLKYNFVRVTSHHLSGRAFAFGPEPERGGVADY